MNAAGNDAVEPALLPQEQERVSSCRSRCYSVIRGAWRFCSVTGTIGDCMDRFGLGQHGARPIYGLAIGTRLLIRYGGETDRDWIAVE
jgi:hypothetical protein